MRCPGHVGVTSARDGSPLLAYHAYVRGDPSNRQMFVAPLRFDAEGWPEVDPPFAGRGEGAPVTGWQWPAGPRPAFSAGRRGIALREGTVARQTGTTRFVAETVLDLADRRARPGLAVTGSEGNAVGIELRASKVVAWSSVAGRRRITGRVRLPPGRPVAGGGRIRLRVAAGQRVGVDVRVRGRWRRVGRPQPPPRWASGARLALSVRARRHIVRFEAPAVRPR